MLATRDSYLCRTYGKFNYQSFMKRLIHPLIKICVPSIGRNFSSHGDLHRTISTSVLTKYTVRLYLPNIRA